MFCSREQANVCEIIFYDVLGTVYWAGGDELWFWSLEWEDDRTGEIRCIVSNAHFIKAVIHTSSVIFLLRDP